MKGKDLQTAIRNSGIPVADVSKGSGIPETTIFKLYKKDTIAEHHLKKLEKAGIKLPKTTNDSGSLADFTQELYREVKQSKDVTISILIKNNETYIDSHKDLVKIAAEHAHTSKIMSKIVDMCINAGVLVIDPTKKIDLTKM